jgi:thiol-disulfide isomerase/thioredoxin
LIGVLIWALVAPESARTDPRRQINGAIVEENPDPAAGFTLARFDGQGDVSLSDYRGKVVILNFWASWCGPCIEEMPLLEQASNEFGEDVVVLGVNVWDDRSSAASFVESLGVSYPILDGGQDEIAVEYGVVGMPETYIVDPNGDVVAYFRGAFDSVQDLRDLIALARTE